MNVTKVALFSILASLFFLTGCKGSSYVDNNMLGGIAMSSSNTTVAVSSSSVVSGSSVTVTVTAKDQNGSLFYVSSMNPNVTLSTSGGTSTGTFSAVTDNQDGTYKATFTGALSGTPTAIVASLFGQTIATTATVQVTASGATTIAVSSGNSQSAVVANSLGSSLVAKVTDSLGNGVSGATVTWTATAGSLGSASTTTDANGLATNSLAAPTASGAITVTAALQGTTSTASFSATATNGPATQIVFTTQPAGGVAQGLALSSQPVLVIEDTYGNPVTSGADATATVSLALTSGTGSLTGTASMSAVAGVATFSGLSIDTQGSGKVLTATKANTFFSGGTTSKSAASNSFTINPPAPGAFTISTAVAGASNVVLTWGASTNVTSYTVKYGTSTGSYGTTFSSSATSPTTVTGLTPGTTYYFMVTATNATSSTNATAEVTATPLAAFTITSATVSAASAVHLIWGASSGASSYTVAYGTSSGTYGTTFSTSATSPTDVTGLTAGTTYYFMVTAVNSSGSVTATAQASATPIGAFTMTSVTPALSSATIAWGAATGMTSYDILYDTTSHAASGSYASSVTGVTTGASVTGLSAGSTYYFRVRANGANGSVLSTNELSTAVYQNFTMSIPFTSGTNSSYTFSNSSTVSLMSSGGVQLTPADQSDTSTNTGVSSGGFQNGTLTGVQWDNAGSILRLNTTTNNAELDASWTPQWSSLVGYWKMNETSGTSFTDSSATGATGTSFGTISYTAGQLVNAIGFDGASGYISASWGLLTGNSSRSFSLWFKTSSTSSANWVSWGTNSANQLSQVGIFSGNIGYLGYSNDLSVAVTTSNYANGKWHHMAVTFDGSNRRLFLDGVNVASDTTTLNTGTSAINLGRSITTTGYYPGYLDDVAIWNTSLTTAQIQTIYQRQSAKYSGQVTSRVVDAYSSQSWTTLSPTTTLPFYKELPGSSGSETSSGYSSQTASLMSGIVGLWHLNGSLA